MNFNIKNDFKDIVKNILSTIYGISQDTLSDDYNTLVIQLSKFIRQRVILERKWNVEISSKINIPNNLKAGFESLVNALEEGKGILRYTTTRIDYIEHDDMMLDCDGFYHFHLSNLPYANNPNFNENRIINLTDINSINEVFNRIKGKHFDYIAGIESNLLSKVSS